MSLDEREYMRSGYKAGGKGPEGVSLLDRLRFFLWRLFHRRPVKGGSPTKNGE